MRGVVVFWQEKTNGIKLPQHARYTSRPETPQPSRFRFKVEKKSELYPALLISIIRFYVIKSHSWCRAGRLGSGWHLL